MTPWNLRSKVLGRYEITSSQLERTDPGPPPRVVDAEGRHQCCAIRGASSPWRDKLHLLEALTGGANGDVYGWSGSVPAR